MDTIPSTIPIIAGYKSDEINYIINAMIANTKDKTALVLVEPELLLTGPPVWLFSLYSMKDLLIFLYS